MIMAMLITSHNSVQRSPFPSFSFCLLSYYHPNWGEIIFHYSFDLHFLIISDVNFSVHLLASSMPSFKKWWASELAQQVNVLATKADDLRAIGLSGGRREPTLQAVRWHPRVHWCTFAHTCVRLHSQQKHHGKRNVFSNSLAVLIRL